uniref:Uncharacterized protein n=1 Tax=Amphora coffeiformis TaxID=265554 RepID=A0A7S3L3E8_9STRA
MMERNKVTVVVVMMMMMMMTITKNPGTTTKIECKQNTNNVVSQPIDRSVGRSVGRSVKQAKLAHTSATERLWWDVWGRMVHTRACDREKEKHQLGEYTSSIYFVMMMVGNERCRETNENIRCPEP